VSGEGTALKRGETINSKDDELELKREKAKRK
jgi:hypothetical protein